MTSISKLLQILKYCFEDKRDSDYNNSIVTERGIICQIQIVFSIFSDYGSLLGTLLLSLRCYDVMKNKKRFSEKKKSKFISLSLIFLISALFAIVFLIIDREKTSNSVGFKYDRRDRCSYWCWIEHTLSLYCYGFYIIFLVLNIIFACKTNKFLSQGYKRLYEQSIVLVDKNKNDTVNSLEEKNNNNINTPKEAETETNEQNYFSELDINRLKEIEIMKIKCLIYPWTTNLIWIFCVVFRVIDDITFLEEDSEEYTDDHDIFDDKQALKFFTQAFLFCHALLSSSRPLIYCFSFAVFEEKTFGALGNFIRKLFFNCFKKFCCCLLFNDFDFNDLENNQENEEIDRKFSTINTTERESNEIEVHRKSSLTDSEKNCDMNTSDYQYND